MKTKFFFLLFLFGAIASHAAPPAAEGKVLFAARCASCHNVHKDLTGPALSGVDGRHSIEWIINFVHSPQTIIKSGDKAAVTLYEKFNKITMPDHPDLTADNIKSIVEYVKRESKNGEEKAPFVKPTKLHPDYKPLSIHNYGFFITYVSSVILLIGVLLFAVQLKEYERNVKFLNK